MPIFLDNARPLWETGYSIIPLKGKQAFLSYDKYRETQCSEDELSKWEREYSNYNIGLITGSASGIAVIDIDIKKNNELLNKALSILPNSPLTRKGSKGLAIFVKYSNQIGRRIYYKGRPIGELITNTLIVIPPSIHPDINKPYEWTGYMDLSSVSKEDVIDLLPTFENRDLDIFELKLEKENIEVSGEFFAETIGRNNRLKAVCGSLMEQGLGIEAIAERLYLEDLSLHKKNPLFSDQKEFRHLSSQPRLAAFKFASSIFNTYIRAKAMRGEIPVQFDKPDDKSTESIDPKYEKFRLFFSQILAGAKRDMVSGSLMIKKDNDWVPCANDLEVYKSKADGEGLAKTNVQMHFYRYEDDMKRELLCSIPGWDGTDYIRELCSNVILEGMDNFVFEDYLKFWGANVFKRITDPGVQNLCLILKGDQGIGKDHLIKTIFRGLDPYFSKFHNHKNTTEIKAQAVRNLVLHIEEFDQTSDKSVAFLKELITSEREEFRLPYDRIAKRFINRCSYISSVNIDSVLRDSSGNRRFAVLPIESIKWGYDPNNSKKILSQFKALAKSGYELKRSSKLAVQENIDLLTPIDSDELIESLWIKDFNTAAQQALFLRYDQCRYIIDEISRILKLHPKSVLGTLKRLGYSTKEGGEIRYYPIKRGWDTAKMGQNVPNDALS